MEAFSFKFVGEVEKHPELYNHTLPEYSRKDCTEKAWNEVAKEVNLSAAECKEKWRNLRSTFVKNLKLKPSGRGATKRPYYLAEAMQFTVPFIKLGGTPSGNLPQRPSPSTSPEFSAMDDSQLESPAIDDPLHETSIIDIKQEPVQSEDIFYEPELPSFLSPPSPQQPTPSPPQALSPSAADSLSPPPQSTGKAGKGLRGPNGQPIRKRKLKNGPTDADKAFAEYFKAKTAKITKTSSGNDKREGIQNFLDSLIPDLMQMDDVQLRTYKRKALLLIDEVMDTSPEVLYCSSTSVVPVSYQGTTAAAKLEPN